jgi:hypothetical protein
MAAHKALKRQQAAEDAFAMGLRCISPSRQLPDGSVFLEKEQKAAVAAAAARRRMKNAACANNKNGNNNNNEDGDGDYEEDFNNQNNNNVDEELDDENVGVGVDNASKSVILCYSTEPNSPSCCSTRSLLIFVTFWTGWFSF